MKKLYSLLLLALLCCACGRGKYYITDTFRRGEVDNIKVLELDSTYDFYLREVYRVKDGPNEYVMRANVPQTDTIERSRIEVEYLLLSWQHKKAVYISTVPDKYQHYYSSHHFADTLINAYDFSTFHFGKIEEDGESVSFSSNDGKKVLSWDIRPFITASHSKKIFIREIAVQRREMMESVILVNKALGEPLYFNHQQSFTVIFETPGRRSDTCQDINSLCRLSDQKIYFKQVKGGFDVLFRFNNNIYDSKDSAIRFDYRRTRYPPIQEKSK